MAPEQNLLLRDYEPRPMLHVEPEASPRPELPVFDAHNHLGLVTFGGNVRPGSRIPARDLLALMDRANVSHMVDLDGHWDDNLRVQLSTYQDPHPDRFVVFAGIDYSNFANDPNFGETEARRLRESAALGARGLTVWKLLGLRARDPDGRLIPVDDPRLDLLWATAGELGLPVLIHIADPVAFFQPLDRFNERWEELERHPDWHFFPTRPRGVLEHPAFPSFEEIIDQFGSLVARHPQTTFIGAHVGCYAENLAWVGRTMDACSNFYVDISARIAELGRQPYTARDFFIRYQDRILFGTDAKPDLATYRLYRRFLETRDEYFNYSPGDRPRNGRWQIYGLDLPTAVLQKVYSGNARRILLNDRQQAEGEAGQVARP